MRAKFSRFMPVNNDRRQFCQRAATAASICCLPGFVSKARADNFSLVMHTAPGSGFFSNSYLFVGEHSSFLVDAQLDADNAHIVAELIKATRKPLERIVITHAHTDHYSGLEVLGPMFPAALVSSSQVSLEEIKSSTRHWQGFNNKFETLQSGEYVFSGVKIECRIMPDAESFAGLVLYIPASGMLLSGDHALNNQHLWLAEKRAQQWLKNLQTIRTRWQINSVLPGHGSIGGTDILRHTESYIEDFLEVVENYPTLEKARKEMIGRYPKLRFEPALDTSLLAYLR